DFPAVEIESHIRFLASDELMGRRTGEPGNNMAARYIAEQFRLYGLSSVEGAEDDYFQSVDLNEVSAPSSGQMVWKDNQFNLKDDFVVLAGDGLEGEYKVAYAQFGIVEEDRDDYQKLDVEGKVVFVLGGLPDQSASPQEVFSYIRKKREWAAERGAVALVEFYRIQFPWPFFVNYFSRPSLRVGGGNEPQIMHIMLQEGTSGMAEKLQKGKHKVQMETEAVNRKPIFSRNVIGMVEGTDPDLKEEYFIVTAHYDHIGTGANGGGPFSPEDSIFNGARDNAVGTTTLLGTAKFVAANPLERTVVFLAVTGEELGLLGSSYYCDNPLIPMEKTIFNFNTDGAGYNKTDRVTLFGYDRTGTINELNAAAERYGLIATDDP
ncbi:MAG: M28 family peptidase, partial [Bacteroidota bacterium]